MRKSKGEKIDLLYINKKKSKAKKEKIKKEIIKKQKKQKASKDSKKNKNFLSQNEIMINIPTIKKNKKKSSKIQKNTKKNKNINLKEKKELENKRVKKQIKKNKEKKSNLKIKRANKIKMKILKWIILITIFFMIVIIFIFSKIFNIKEIKVINNSKVTTVEIIEKSELSQQQNIFKISERKIEKKLKENSYIESIEIKKNFNCTITIIVKEREAKYILKFANALVFLNNQGYILEILETETYKEEIILPMIIGFKTNIENIKTGERLNKEDLERLETIIKITKAAKENDIKDLITQIDISDPKKYVLNLENEFKTVYFGEDKYINDKIIRIKAIVEKEKSIEGIIFVENMEKVYFREKV